MKNVARIVLAAFLAVGIAAGCGGTDGDRAGADAGLTAAELGELGGRIYVEPDRAEELLDRAGLTAEEFEARIREVSSDPEVAREYTEAFDAVIDRSASSDP